MTQPFYSALDFGAKKTVLLIARKNASGEWQILGAGDSASAGARSGEIENLSDAVESVMEAARKAQKAAGLKIDTLYFNFDDLKLQSLRAQGMKTLKGEGEIQRSDVRDASETALRHVENFEAKTIYAKEVRFVIDEQDPVWDPIGVFGSQLEVTMHVLQARSESYQAWKRVIERAHISDVVFVPSAWSTAYGVLAPGDREKKRLMVDLGADFFNFFVFEKGRITDSCVLPPMTDPNTAYDESASLVLKNFAEKTNAEELVATGDWAVESKTLERLEDFFKIPVQAGSPKGVTGVLAQPPFASVVGLLSVAEEMEKKSAKLTRPKSFIGEVKRKATSLIHEYF